MGEITFECNDCGRILFKLLNTSDGKAIAVGFEADAEVVPSQRKVLIGWCESCIGEIPECENCQESLDAALKLENSEECFKETLKEKDDEIILLRTQVFDWNNMVSDLRREVKELRARFIF